MTMERCDHSHQSGAAADSDDAHSRDGSVGGGAVDHHFPSRLHTMLHQLEESPEASVVHWQPHGHAFMIRDTNAFVENILPK